MSTDAGKWQVAQMLAQSAPTQGDLDQVNARFSWNIEYGAGGELGYWDMPAYYWGALAIWVPLGQAQQGSDWTNAAQFGLTVGEFFRNVKSYQFNGTDASRAIDLLDGGKFLHNGKAYTSKFYGNQYIGKATIQKSKSAFQQSAKYLKGAGRALGAINLAVTGYQVVGDLSDGKYYSGGARVAVATIAAGAAFIPVVGWGITIGIGVADAIWGD